jgi:hypothetical protein
MLKLIQRIILISLLKKTFDLVNFNFKKSQSNSPPKRFLKIDSKTDDSTLGMSLSISGFSFFYKFLSRGLSKSLKVENNAFIHFLSGRSIVHFLVT